MPDYFYVPLLSDLIMYNGILYWFRTAMMIQKKNKIKKQTVR